MHIGPGPRYRITDDGPEARCSRCREWWPADEEFFYRQTDGRPHSMCIACYREWRNQRNQQRARERIPPAATGTTATTRNLP